MYSITQFVRMMLSQFLTILWFQNDFNAVIHFHTEDFIPIGGFFQRQMVGDNIAQIDFPVINELK